MKFKMNKNSLKLLLVSALLATSLPALALTGDSDKPVNIDSVNRRSICRVTSPPLPAT